jgi:hypothetical protein
MTKILNKNEAHIQIIIVAEESQARQGKIVL